MPRNVTSEPSPIGLSATRRQMLVLAALGMAGVKPAMAAPTGQLTFAVHISLAPTWFDPAETPSLVTPYMLYYAMHDAMLKPMPGELMAHSLAESWSATEDGMSYSFVLRDGVTFHNGEKVTSEDVKFSFERYRGAAKGPLHDRVASVETPDARHITFRLKNPWPDFITFYAATTGAGWIVPKKYLEQVGDEGFKKAPIGAGPYKFVSFTPGVELILEANESYWRKPVSVKRLVLKVIPEEATRLAALKNGEVDIAYSIRGELAQEIPKTPGLALKPTVIQSPFWLYFPEQWDAKSPWHDVRVRQAARLALDLKTINQALTLGFSRVHGSMIPDNFEFFWKPPQPVYDPEKAKHLLAEAGYPSGFDAGFYNCDASYANLAEATNDYLGAVGIRAKLRPLERVSFNQQFQEKKLKNIIQTGSGSFGNAATRFETFIVKGGAYVYGSYPDLDEMFQQQAVELDHGRRADILTKMQQILYERVVSTHLWQLAFINGVGARVGESNFGRIAGFPYTAPYEDLTLKSA
ncbi:MAG TPA: ABC transporter substrate-binding protein [Acetobacteraceae bacterium]|jgi:peptide/nickel transport system substrate-binding protein|nr:ABC transporter substrate-binding protein [Acetobacteraceae bacterium]